MKLLSSLALCALLACLLAACGGSSGPDAPAPAQPRILVSDAERIGYAGQSMTLHAYAPGLTGLSYEWQQISGPKVARTGADTAELHFVAPTPTGTETTLAFKVRATGPDGVVESQKVTVFIYPDRNVVVAASTRSVSALAGNTVSLHATGAGAASPSYAWTQLAPADTPVALQGASTDNASFVAPNVDGLTLRFQVRYTDASDGRSALDTVDVRVSRPPTQASDTGLTVAGATAAPRQVLSLLAAPDATVVSGGATSVALGVVGGRAPYQWSWAQVGGAAAGLAGQNQALLQVSAPAVASPQFLRFEATVTDADGSSRTGIAQVLAVPAPAPGASAAPALTPLPVSRILGTGGSPVTALTQLANPSVRQTSGPVSAVATAADPQAPGATVITITPPVIGSSTEMAQFEVFGTAANGQAAREIVLLSVLRAPGVLPPVTPPPQVAAPTAPPLALQLVSCGPARADEGQLDVRLGICASGGTGAYTYAWTYEPISVLASLALRDATTSRPAVDLPQVSGPTLLRFRVTVSDGQQTSSTRVFLGVNDLAPSLRVAAIGQVVAQSGQRVSLSPPAPVGGVPPYAWAVSQTAGPSVGALVGANPTFTAPVLAAGAADQTLGFRYTLTDALGNAAQVEETVLVHAPPPPLGAVVHGPSSGEQGASVTLNANATGGVAPYSFRYSVTGAPGAVAIPATANPTFALPAIAVGGSDIALAIRLTVTDSSVPPLTVQSAVLGIAVAAPPAAQAPATGPAGAEAVAAAQQLGTALASTTTAAQAIQAAIDAASKLPESAKTAGILVGRVTAGNPSCAVRLLQDPATGQPICRDAYAGDCAVDFAGLYDNCVVAVACQKTAGYCRGVTPEMQRLLSENARRLACLADPGAPGCQP